MTYLIGSRPYCKDRNNMNSTGSKQRMVQRLYRSPSVLGLGKIRSLEPPNRLNFVALEQRAVVQGRRRANKITKKVFSSFFKIRYPKTLVAKCVEIE